jgi:hypothetical protein
MQVEFLKEAAEQAIEDVVQSATDLRTLTAFLSCSTARSALLRAKAAATGVHLSKLQTWSIATDMVCAVLRLQITYISSKCREINIDRCS